MFRTGLSVHHQELKTAYTATVYVKQLLLSGMSWNPLSDVHRCCIRSFELLMMDGKTRPKHVERFTRINDLRKQMHLVGCTIEIYYDART